MMWYTENMSMRKQKIILLIVLIVLSIVGFFIAQPIRYGLCSNIDPQCSKIWKGAIGTPVFYFSLASILPLLMMVFLKDRVFQVWKKFTLIYIFISIILISLMPTTAPGFNIVDKQIATQSLSILFFILSIILFVVVSLREKQKVS